MGLAGVVYQIVFKPDKAYCVMIDYGYSDLEVTDAYALVKLIENMTDW
jgi:hypothetical protein